MNFQKTICGFVIVVSLFSVSCPRQDEFWEFPPRSYDSEIRRANELSWHLQNRFPDDGRELPRDLLELATTMNLEKELWVFWAKDEEGEQYQVWNYFPDKKRILILDQKFDNERRKVQIAINRDFTVEEF